MNRSAIFVMTLSCLLILSLPFLSFAEEKKGGYIVIKPGAYIPQGNLNDKGFDTNFAGEIAIGTYYLPNLAIEAGTGYFQTKASKNENGINEEDKIWVIPVTVTFKGVLPLKGAELYAGGGVGVYFAHINAEGNNSSGSFSNDGHGVALGVYPVVGANIDITKKVFLGVEGKYLFTTGADLLDAKPNLNGVFVTGVLGYRF